MLKNSIIRNMQKKGIIPKKCPHCKSSRLELSEFKRDNILHKGFLCKKCGYKNLRRFKEVK